MKYTAIVVSLILLPLFCMAQNQSQEAAHPQSMEQRGNQGMGFEQQKITHHFLLTKDGGIIQVSAHFF